MNLVDVSVFTAEAATRIAGAPNATLRQELMGTFREFFVWSGSYLARTNPIDIIANQREYTLPAPTSSNILTTYAALVDDRQVRFTGTPIPGTIALHIKYPEDKPDALVGIVAIKPQDYSLVPEDTVTYDFDTILDGLCGRMYNMPDKPWTNTVQARYHLRRFRSGMGQARVRVRSLYTTADAGWRYPPW